MSEESIRELLQELADADALAEARPAVEIRLRKAFRARRRKRAWRRGITWTASAAAIVLMVVFVNRRPPVTPPKPISAHEVQAPEIVTEFFPLMDPAPPFQHGRILRIELPASAMEMVGLPVHEQRRGDPVQADVLIGEEGLPRAIRFVKLERQ